MKNVEFSDKKQNGCIFRCDSKFGPDHKCLDKSLKILIVREEDEEECEEGEELVEIDMVSLSPSLVMGITTPHTMKLRGKVREREVLVLIKCGATHIFLSVKMVVPLGLVIKGKSQRE